MSHRQSVSLESQMAGTGQRAFPERQRLETRSGDLSSTETETKHGNVRSAEKEGWESDDPRAFLVTYGCGRVQNDIQRIDWNNRARTF